MAIREVPDGVDLPYYDLVEPQPADREVKDGGHDIKIISYPVADNHLEIGVIRRRTHRTTRGEKAPLDEELAKENIAVRLQLSLGTPDASSVDVIAKEIAAQPWLDCDLTIDDESVRGCRWRQDGWSAVMYLTPTLIIYVILPDDQVVQPVRLRQLASQSVALFGSDFQRLCQMRRSTRNDDA
jgi:hypothetical protein